MGIGSATMLGVAAIGMYQGADTAQVPQIAEDLRVMGSTVLTAALLKASAWVGAEQVCRKFLNDAGVEFDAEWWKTTQRDVRGATPLPVDSELSDPTIQDAAKEVFRQLANDPETRSDVLTMIRVNPNLRESLANSSLDAQAQSVMTPKIDPEDDMDELSGPRM